MTEIVKAIEKIAKEIYEALAISDIKATCDLFMDNFKG